MIDLEFLEKLIEALDASGLDSVEIERGGTRVRLARTAPQVVASAAPAFHPAAAEAAPGTSPGPVPVVPGDAETEGEATQSHLTEVESPMVGTFYRAPAPDAPPYVEVGQRIAPGDTLCIIEAMKLMNELEAEVAGTVAEICVDNAEPVEFGQVLYRIDPA
jgi:acetyl-CoA carboxylase biotin carboxyl carrier protein